MTSVREARIETAKNAMLESQQGYKGWDTTVPEYVAQWLAEAAVDALFPPSAESCEFCGHRPHSGRECGEYTTEDIHDTVGFFHEPSGKTFTLVKGICRCGRPYEEGDFKVYPVDSGNFVIAWKGEWLEGSFPSIQEALKSGREQVKS